MLVLTCNVATDFLLIKRNLALISKRTNSLRQNILFLKWTKLYAETEMLPICIPVHFNIEESAQVVAMHIASLD